MATAAYCAAAVSTPAATSVALSLTLGGTKPRGGEGRGSSSSLKFPRDVPDVVKTAINNYVPSEDYYLAKVNHGNPSIIHSWGGEVGH